MEMTKQMAEIADAVKENTNASLEEMKSQSRLTDEMIHHIEETHEFFESIKNTIAQHIEAECIADQQLASGVEGIQQAASLTKWITMKICFL